MKTIIAILALAVASITSAQTAKVVQLSPVDVDAIKSLYEQKAEIEKKLADLTEKIQHQYVSTERISPTQGCISIGNVNGTWSTPHCPTSKPTPEQEKDSHTFIIRPGWENGIEFSEDFKFIVPKAYEPAKTCSLWQTSPYVYGGALITPTLTTNN